MLNWQRLDHSDQQGASILRFRMLLWHASSLSPTTKSFIVKLLLGIAAVAATWIAAKKEITDHISHIGTASQGTYISDTELTRVLDTIANNPNMRNYLIDINAGENHEFAGSLLTFITEIPDKDIAKVDTFFVHIDYDKLSAPAQEKVKAMKTSNKSAHMWIHLRRLINSADRGGDMEAVERVLTWVSLVLSPDSWTEAAQKHVHATADVLKTAWKNICNILPDGEIRIPTVCTPLAKETSRAWTNTPESPFANLTIAQILKELQQDNPVM